MSEPQNVDLSRRKFFKGAIATAAAAIPASGLIGCAEAGKAPPGATAAAPAEFDLTQQSNALQPDTIVDSACQFCNSLCRLKVHLKAGRVIDITGETEDPVQAGGLCVKGPMMAQLVYNRLRLTTPLKRVGGEKGSPDSKFEPVSWDEALGIIAKKLVALRDAGEAHDRQQDFRPPAARHRVGRRPLLHVARQPQ